MASKKVRLPSARITNVSGVEDSTEIFDDEDPTILTERTSGLISDVFETDQGQISKLLKCSDFISDLVPGKVPLLENVARFAYLMSFTLIESISMPLPLQPLAIVTLDIFEIQKIVNGVSGFQRQTFSRYLV